jgi:very-short-patch-repair endonuclease
MKGQTNSKIKAHQLQRTLRKNPTDAERALWRELRDKQINNFKFRRQHIHENFILDFVCIEAKLVIEVDGGQHVDNQQQDQNRTAQLQQAGFTVLRFWNHQVLNEMESVKQAILLALKSDPSPP